MVRHSTDESEGPEMVQPTLQRPMQESQLCELKDGNHSLLQNKVSP